MYSSSYVFAAQVYIVYLSTYAKCTKSFTATIFVHLFVTSTLNSVCASTPSNTLLHAFQSMHIQHVSGLIES